MKSIEIYITNKNFKICTLYRLEYGSYISSEPIFILPSNAKLEDISNKLFEALNTSRNLTESEEDKFWLGNNLLKKLKESSFDKLYRTSFSCRVSLKENTLNVVPYKYRGKNKGMEEEMSRELNVVLDNNQIEIIKIILQMQSH